MTVWRMPCGVLLFAFYGGGFMILKFGTLKELAQHKGQMSEEVFCHLHSSLRILDENYGANRNIDLDVCVAIFIERRANLGKTA